MASVGVDGTERGHPHPLGLILAVRRSPANR
jgi:hypothetical protein